MRKHTVILFIALVLLASCQSNDPTPTPSTRVLRISSVKINNMSWTNGATVYNIGFGKNPVVQITFNDSINLNQFSYSKMTFSAELDSNYTISKGSDNKTLILQLNATPKEFSEYTFSIQAADYLGGQVYPSFSAKFITGVDSVQKFPTISDDSLLTLVQKQTFKYFWDYGHPVSGLARERYGSGETTTIGGSGFGIMTIPVAIERGFITRQQGFERLNTIVNFLYTKADRFHGAFPHWLNGTTGAVIPFSTKDDGADLVETAFMIQGLLTVQQYFKNGSSTEQAMCNTIQKIWEEVEWNWFQQDGQQKLYWHWSPDYNWDMNMPISGWNEGLIVYVLAASSPTYPIGKSVYDNGWAQNGAIQNGNIYYNITLPLGADKGGPLFFAHYSFLGLNPAQLQDQYANYWTQNTAHALINYSYCVSNPNGNTGYSADCWGLTASDIQGGYTASSPTNDVGTIAPTAALASFPYTPAQSMKALHFFYYILGNKIWGDYGFTDAFNLNQRWFATSYLAIDQGPIVVMIENYRTALLWNLFMQNTDIQAGLDKLGFRY